MKLSSVLPRVPRLVFGRAEAPSADNAPADGVRTVSAPDSGAVTQTHHFDSGNGGPVLYVTATFVHVDDDLESSADGGVHSITRATNYWFNMNLSQLEKTAKQYAIEWADKGLPRHDIPRDAPLEVEEVLANRATELFREWGDRVLVKVRDAIELGSQAASAQVSKLQSCVARAESAHSEALGANRQMRELHDASSVDATPVRYTPLLHNKFWFWAGAVSLASVEFFANFPVFRLMLPMNSSLGDLARQAAENAEGNEWTAGPIMLLKDILLHPEAAVVALVAVIVIVGLSKTLGSAIRPLVAFDAAEHPLAAPTIRTCHREAWFMGGLSLLGITFALCFLFLSRGQIASAATERVARDSFEKSTLETRLSSMGNDSLTAANDVRRRLRDVTRTLDQHTDDAKYAETVQRNNFPISLLNSALVIMAALLGFLIKSDDLTDKRGEHPGLALLRVRLTDLGRDAAEQIINARSAASAAQLEVMKVRHLLRSQPLHDWRAKQDRLQAVIPLWRGENARLRGMDPGSILAFQGPVVMQFPTLAEQGFDEPADFAQVVQDLAHAEIALARLAPQATPVIPMRAFGAFQPRVA